MGMWRSRAGITALCAMLIFVGLNRDRHGSSIKIAVMGIQKLLKDQ